jgi:Ca2+-transporting ATPase
MANASSGRVPLNCFAQDSAALLAELASGPQGLSQTAAEERLQRYGLNELRENKPISPLALFLNQFRSTVVIILIVATLISWLIGESLEAETIVTILLLIAVFGFLQEFRAERAMRALLQLASPKATVLRDGERLEIEARKVVPGDVMVLEMGTVVTADGRLLEAVNLQAHEALLTGETEPVPKHTRSLSAELALAERRNMVYSGTIITQGRGKALVTATGMATEVGKIAASLQETPPGATPLQVKLDQLGRSLGLITVLICLLVFSVGLLSNPAALARLRAFDIPGFLQTAKEGFLVAVALAVAAIPEGLPAVVTISLALGTRRMLARNALVRRLPSVETLGETTVICAGKTGTLTLNQMTVEQLFVYHRVMAVSGVGYEVRGEIIHGSEPVARQAVERLLIAGALNNDAELHDGVVIGDPTEGALLVSAAKLGLDKRALESAYPRLDEIGFTSERKMMTTFHAREGKLIAFAKGATEVILQCCSDLAIDDQIRPLTAADKAAIAEANCNFSAQGLRVLAFAYKADVEIPSEEGFIFVGLQAMRDPPRPEVPAAIRECREAGIKVIMITGDHELTAQVIGTALGLEGKCLSGSDLDRIDDLGTLVEEVSIYARVNPEHKLRIVSALKKRGHHIVAMTGDGVNDAPALQAADIGVAMGSGGTEVSKAASDMVLMDNNFASIVSAVEEGRKIYDNIRKYVQYLLSSNIAEVLIIFLAVPLGFPLPLLAIQILLMNLVTDGAPAIALSLEPGEPDLMRRPPRDPDEAMLSRFTALKMALLAAAMTLVTLAAFAFYLQRPCSECADPLAYPRTFAFTTLVMLEMFNVLNSKSDRLSVRTAGLFNNPWLWAAVASSVLIQLLAVQWAPYALFNTVPLTARDWALSVLLGSSVLIVGEGIKACSRAWGRDRPSFA